MHDGGHSWRRTLLTGLAIVAAPILGLNALLALNTITTAQREIDSVATAALGVAEQRLDDAATQLVLLGLKHVDGCGAAEIDAMQAAAQGARFVSEVAAVNAAGEGACAAFGEPHVLRSVSPEHGAQSPEVTLSAVAIGGASAQRLIRLQWRYPGGTGLRVLIPGDDVFPHFLRSRMTSGFEAQAVLMDGGVISRKLTDASLSHPDAAPWLAISGAAASARYPLKIDVSAPGSALLRANASLFIYANIGGLAFALMVALVAFVLGRRTGGPIREIAIGIRRGEFVPYYQPVIDITSGRILGCEVLVRWAKSDGRVLPPGRFISLAEASGEIFPMTLALMEATRNDLAEVYAARPGLKVGFNLFAGHFEDLAIVDDVKRIFEQSPIRMNQLMFEVTERQALPDIPRARLVIGRLQSLGARVALDDVGTGHGGLSYLLKLGVDVMKMDKMFIDAIGTDRYSVAIVDSMVRLADDMNLDLIAEGVETMEQVEYLRAKGVRMAQGYIFAPPLPFSSFKTLVEAMAPISRREARERASRGRLADARQAG